MERRGISSRCVDVAAKGGIVIPSSETEIDSSDPIQRSEMTLIVIERSDSERIEMIIS